MSARCSAAASTDVRAGGRRRAGRPTRRCSRWSRRASATPLTMARRAPDHRALRDARAAIADIQVFGEPDGDGVRLRYEVVPIARIARVRFERAARARRERAAHGADRPVRRHAGGRAGAPRWRRRSWRATRRTATRGARRVARSSPERRPGQVAAVVRGDAGPAGAGRAGHASRATPAGAICCSGSTCSRAGRSTARPSTSACARPRTRCATGGYYEAVVSATVRDGRRRRGRRHRARRPRRPGARSTSPAIRCPTTGAARSCRSSSCARWKRRWSRTPAATSSSTCGSRAIALADGAGRAAARRRPCCASPSPCGADRCTCSARWRSTASPALPRGRAAAAAEAGAGRAVRRCPRAARRPPRWPSYYRVRGFAAVRVTPRLTSPAPTDGAGAGRRALRGRRGPAHRGRRRCASRARRRVPPAQLLERAGPHRRASPTTGRSRRIDRDAIERRYRNLGYQRAAVEARTGADAGRRRRRAHLRGARRAADAGRPRARQRHRAHVARPRAPRADARSPAARSATTRVIESQQRLSALGLFRRVRITEAPHGADETSRDVLVEVEEAPSTSAQLRRRVRGRAVSRASATTARPPTGSTRRRAASSR